MSRDDPKKNRVDIATLKNYLLRVAGDLVTSYFNILHTRIGGRLNTQIIYYCYINGSSVAFLRSHLILASAFSRRLRVVGFS